MSNYQTLLYEKQRKGVLITLNRPDALNAMNQDLLGELDQALAEAETDPDIRAVVLTGAGNTFSVGEDISGNDPGTAWPYGIPEGSSLVHEYNRLRDADRRDILGRQLYRWEYPKPIIGAISGWCLGAASWLALTCHVTIAADDAVFGQPQVRHGENTDFIWVALAGFKNALRYSLTGDPVDAKEALRMGLVNQVVPKDKLLEECFAFVERIAHVPPETVKINLDSHQRNGNDGPPKGVDTECRARGDGPPHETRRVQQALRRRKKKGGLAAFLEARDKPFQPEPFGPKAKK